MNNEQKEAGLASDLNNELDSLLDIARLFEQSKRRTVCAM